MDGKAAVQQINTSLKGKSIVDKLKYLLENHRGKVVFTTSFGYEDQVITDIIFKNDLPVEVVTLDTGRMFEETYKVFRSTVEKYGKTIKVYFPPTAEVEKMLDEKGPFSFYESVENRKQCCFIRKVVPLKRALESHEVWITGLRASQSANRSGLHDFEWDAGNRIIKYNPLLEWSLDDVKQYVKENNVPYNVLHDKGFVSIGCEPCTRAIRPGEDFRAGRWWWEQNSGKECGLHESNSAS
ncbi:phosphoadenylylsulfate reductase (thioredoxin) [Mariniphaga anaerophila]|uniref:Adenosine 5'-phosphosulfate reductase n=1 Tax=Mariniphaga anaerophila TaxID=1484053 RepID=A0A1M4TH91_9BACT|nr:phosphoadenylyl-sulfate reductase [Mariniphaga anaerophila]SHE43765.1 phosphoadenylylsulfate reductase (thioredoxin) [Mariniphaga anaerophila]